MGSAPGGMSRRHSSNASRLAYSSFWRSTKDHVPCLTPFTVTSMATMRSCRGDAVGWSGRVGAGTWARVGKGQRTTSVMTRTQDHPFLFSQRGFEGLGRAIVVADLQLQGADRDLGRAVQLERARDAGQDVATQL